MLNLSKLLAGIFVCFLFSATVKAQNNKLGGWYVANFIYKPDKKWFIYFETQTRSQKVFNDFFYHELKAGAGYNLPKNNSVFFGLGDYVTYPFPGNFKSPASVKEFRMWEQFVLNNNIDRLKIEHRYRIEQRWLNGEYNDRFRYRLNPILPLNKTSMQPNTFFVSAFDEVFFTSKAPYFLRNRFFAGLGYEFSKFFTLQSGFIRQFDYNATTNGSGKNFIQTTLFFVVDKSNSNKEILPGTID